MSNFNQFELDDGDDSTEEESRILKSDSEMDTKDSASAENEDSEMIERDDGEDEVEDGVVWDDESQKKVAESGEREIPLEDELASETQEDDTKRTDASDKISTDSSVDYSPKRSSTPATMMEELESRDEVKHSEELVSMDATKSPVKQETPLKEISTGMMPTELNQQTPNTVASYDGGEETETTSVVSSSSFSTNGAISADIKMAEHNQTSRQQMTSTPKSTESAEESTESTTESESVELGHYLMKQYNLPKPFKLHRKCDDKKVKKCRDRFLKKSLKIQKDSDSDSISDKKMRKHVKKYCK